MNAPSANEDNEDDVDSNADSPKPGLNHPYAGPPPNSDLQAGFCLSVAAALHTDQDDVRANGHGFESPAVWQKGVQQNLQNLSFSSEDQLCTENAPTGVNQPGNADDNAPKSHQPGNADDNDPNAPEVAPNPHHERPDAYQALPVSNTVPEVRLEDLRDPRNTKAFMEASVYLNIGRVLLRCDGDTFSFFKRRKPWWQKLEHKHNINVSAAITAIVKRDGTLKCMLSGRVRVCAISEPGCILLQIVFKSSLVSESDKYCFALELTDPNHLRRLEENNWGNFAIQALVEGMQDVTPFCILVDHTITRIQNENACEVCCSTKYAFRTVCRMIEQFFRADNPQWKQQVMRLVDYLLMDAGQIVELWKKAATGGKVLNCIIDCGLEQHSKQIDDALTSYAGGDCAGMHEKGQPAGASASILAEPSLPLCPQVATN